MPPAGAISSSCGPRPAARSGFPPTRAALRVPPALKGSSKIVRPNFSRYVGSWLHSMIPNSCAASTNSRAMGAATWRRSRRVPPPPRRRFDVRAAPYGANPANQECGIAFAELRGAGLARHLHGFAVHPRRAVPSVTTRRIALARNARLRGRQNFARPSARGLPSPATQRPCGIWPPAAIVAATRAILNGVITTGP